MKAFLNIMKAALLPLIILSCACMAASALWLIILGQWRFLWVGAGIFLASPMFFPILVLPAGILSGCAQISRSSPRVSKTFEMLTLTWLVSLVAFFAALSYELVDPLINSPMILPALLWAASAAVVPWAVHARHDRDNLLFTCLVLMMAVGCAASATMDLLHFQLTFGLRFMMVAAVVSGLLGLHFLYEEHTARREKKI